VWIRPFLPGVAVPLFGTGPDRLPGRMGLAHRIPFARSRRGGDTSPPPVA
jgi:hypothetical protein